MKKRRALFTCGYEGLTIDEFTGMLQKAGVDLLLDIRELPLSRRRGFSKTGLATVMESKGIQYLHLRSLGCPKEIRLRYKEDGDWSAYARAFEAYLRTQDAAVADVAGTALTRTACLLCFEADYERCHRSIVARTARREGGPEVWHLTAKGARSDVTR